MKEKIVCFLHGQEGKPWGTKITVLSKIASAKGFGVESPDFSAVMDPDRRVQMLRELKPEAKESLVLVGSSMGGYVAAAASGDIGPAGLFLMAPAFYIPGYQQQEPVPQAKKTVLVHGWKDEVVPVDHSIRYARRYEAALHVLDGDHRLISVLSTVETLFGMFLDELREA